MQFIVIAKVVCAGSGACAPLRFVGRFQGRGSRQIGFRPPPAEAIFIGGRLTANFNQPTKGTLVMGLRSAAVALLLVAVPAIAMAQLDSPNRKEIKRVDLSGAQHFEVINSVTEYKPGDELKLHIHHGEESAYVVQGATVQAPGKEPMKLPTGASLINLRDVPHGGFKIIGDSNLILFTVHIVEKGKPLYDAPK